MIVNVAKIPLEKLRNTNFYLNMFMSDRFKSNLSYDGSKIIAVSKLPNLSNRSLALWKDNKPTCQNEVSTVLYR